MASGGDECCSFLRPGGRLTAPGQSCFVLFLSLVILVCCVRQGGLVIDCQHFLTGPGVYDSGVFLFSRPKETSYESLVSIGVHG